MAKRDEGSKKKKVAAAEQPSAAAGGEMEPRLVAFAEQIGRMAGTLQARADALLDRAALAEQIASVRDGAASLLEQLAGRVTQTAQPTPEAPAKATKAKGRSGGVVDAPGKKHRKPPPAGPAKGIAKSQASKLRTAKTMVKTNRRRGRG